MSEERTMPGIDFRELRALVSIGDVLELAGFIPVARTGDQVRGPCPIHDTKAPRGRSFSANLRKNTFRCFGCGVGGNQLDLWVALSHFPLAEAAADLCRRLAIELPLVHRKLETLRRQNREEEPVRAPPEASGR
jgi:DNA primase